jgi:hypothetical protein
MNIPIIVGGIIALGCLVVAFRFLHKKRLIDDLPTLSVLQFRLSWRPDPSTCY